MEGKRIFRRTTYPGKRTKPYKHIPCEVIHETPPSSTLKETMSRRGIVEGRHVTVDHPKKAWSSTTRSSGQIVQVTRCFFVLWQPKRNYHECFLFVDVMRSVVKVREERKNT